MNAIDLGRWLSVLRSWGWLLLTALVVAGGISYLSSSRVPRTYVSSTTLFVGDVARNPKPGDEDFSASQRLADAYAQIAQRQPVLEGAIRRLGLPIGWEELRRRVVVFHQSGSLLIEIRVSDADPTRARDIAATLAQQLIEISPTGDNRLDLESRRQFVKEELDLHQTRIQALKEELDRKRTALAREISARGVLDRQDEIRALEQNLASWRTNYATLLASYDDKTGPNTLAVIEPAVVPRQPAGPNVWWNVAFAAVAGLLMASVGVLLIEHFDNRVRSRAEVETLLAASKLGVIPFELPLSHRETQLPVVAEPQSPVAEAYRVLASNVRFASLGQGRLSMLVTSASQGEGKSTTAANLAAACAQAGRSVLLVDLDLRSPCLHAMFGIANHAGVTNLLLSPLLDPQSCIVPTAQPGLSLLPSGPLPPNPSEVVARFGEALLRRLADSAEVVVLDGPPLLVGADALALAGAASQTLVVVRPGQVRRGNLAATREALARTRARVLGVVCNGVSRSELATYGYGAGYYHAPPGDRRLARIERRLRPLLPPGRATDAFLAALRSRGGQHE